MASILKPKCFPVGALTVILAISQVACDTQRAYPGAGIRGVNFVGVAVSDLQRSAEFYTTGADLTAVAGYESSSIAPVLSLPGTNANDVQSALLRTSNAQLRLMQFDEVPTANEWQPVPVYGPGIAHICFQVNKNTDTYERFLTLGAEHIGDRNMVQLSSRKPVEYAYILDLEGAVIEVEQVDVSALDLPTPPANDYRIRHVSFATPDIDVLVAFYSRLLGGQKPREAGHWFGLSGKKLDRISGLKDARIEMSWLQARNVELEFVQYISQPTAAPKSPRPLNAPGYNMVMFDVTDLEGASDALLAAGGTVVVASMKLDDGEVLFGRDPDGNLLGFQRVADNALVSSQNFENNGL